MSIINNKEIITFPYHKCTTPKIALANKKMIDWVNEHGKCSPTYEEDLRVFDNERYLICRSEYTRLGKEGKGFTYNSFDKRSISAIEIGLEIEREIRARCIEADLHYDSWRECFAKNPRYKPDTPHCCDEDEEFHKLWELGREEHVFL